MKITSIMVLASLSILLLFSQVKASMGGDPTYFKLINVSSHLNVRKGPSTSYPIVRKLKSDTIIAAYDFKGKGQKAWAHLAPEYDIKEWVDMKYLKEYSGLDLSKEHYVFTLDKVSSLNVRKGPSTNQQILKKLPNDTTGIRVFKTSKKDKRWWAKIQWDGKTGWVGSYYLLPLDIYTVKRGDTLYQIAMNIGYELKKIAVLNRLSEPYILNIGQKLKIPFGQCFNGDC